MAVFCEELPHELGMSLWFWVKICDHFRTAYKYLCALFDRRFCCSSQCRDVNSSSFNVQLSLRVHLLHWNGGGDLAGGDWSQHLHFCVGWGNVPLHCSRGHGTFKTNLFTIFDIKLDDIHFKSHRFPRWTKLRRKRARFPSRRECGSCFCKTLDCLLASQLYLFLPNIKIIFTFNPIHTTLSHVIIACKLELKGVVFIKYYYI